MGTITTSFLNSFKTDLMSALHNFNAQITFTGTPTNATFTLTSVSALTGLAVGMGLSGTNIPAGTVIASIDSSTQITMSKAATGSPGAITVTATGDVMNMALIKFSPTGTYGATNTNYTDLTTDEVSGTGYVAGGTAMTNVSPSLSSTTAIVNFSPNPSWTTATIDAAGCMIYNNSRRGPVATRACSVHDFGGEQKVTAGTFTVVMPTADSTHAILRIS